MTKRYTVEFNAKVTPVKPLNDEFTLCKCYVMALDKNRNLSFISQDAADAALPTLFNIPVIGHLYVDDEGKYHMGGHDMTIVQNSDGQYEFKSICVPYGVVPQQDGIHYEDIQEPNGDTHTYLVADIILWTGRFPELHEAIYNEETYFGQSMEINVHDYAPLDEDKNYTNILEYTYSALCLLGKSDNPDFHTEPCFPMARVDVREFSIEDEKFVELMTQLKSELAFCFGDTGKKGGESMNENETVVTEQVETTENFEEAEETIATTAEATEVVEEPITTTEYSADESTENSEGENFEETHTDAVEQPQTFSSTYREKREAIDNALPYVHETDENGNVIRDVWYWLCDFDDVYAFVERCEYTKDSGSTETKGRFAYVFNEEDGSVTIEGEMEEMFVRWLTRDELDQLEVQRAQYEELVEYKAERVKAEHDAAIDAVIGEFTDLEGNEAFAAIVADKYSFENIEALKDACYIVRGKISAPASQRSKKPDDVSVPVGTHIESDVYEGFFAKYGKRK